MGGSQSTKDNFAGFRIFKVSKNSPAERAGLEMFFDYIVEIDDISLNNFNIDSQQLFFSKIRESVDKPIKFKVFNVRTRSFRELWITPTKWIANGLLGATVRHDAVENALTQGIRVLEVFENSPAAFAGLVPYHDYILSSSEVIFKDLDELIDTVSSSLNRELQIFVYNSANETIREVHILPNNNWGGEGCLGCDIGTGYLHRIPQSRRINTNFSSNNVSRSFDKNIGCVDTVSVVTRGVGGNNGCIQSNILQHNVISSTLPPSPSFSPLLNNNNNNWNSSIRVGSEMYTQYCIAPSSSSSSLPNPSPIGCTGGDVNMLNNNSNANGYMYNNNNLNMLPYNYNYTNSNNVSYHHNNHIVTNSNNFPSTLQPIAKYPSFSTPYEGNMLNNNNGIALQHFQIGVGGIGVSADSSQNFTLHNLAFTHPNVLTQANETEISRVAINHPVYPINVSNSSTVSLISSPSRLEEKRNNTSNNASNFSSHELCSVVGGIHSPPVIAQQQQTQAIITHNNEEQKHMNNINTSPHIILRQNAETTQNFINTNTQFNNNNNSNAHINSQQLSSISASNVNTQQSTVEGTGDAQNGIISKQNSLTNHANSCNNNLGVLGTTNSNKNSNNNLLRGNNNNINCLDEENNQMQTNYVNDNQSVESHQQQQSSSYTISAEGEINTNKNVKDNNTSIMGVTPLPSIEQQLAQQSSVPTVYRIPANCMQSSSPLMIQNNKNVKCKVTNASVYQNVSQAKYAQLEPGTVFYQHLPPFPGVVYAASVGQ